MHREAIKLATEERIEEWVGTEIEIEIEIETETEIEIEIEIETGIEIVSEVNDVLEGELKMRTTTRQQNDEKSNVREGEA
jgi:hypothetical protein